MYEVKDVVCDYGIFEDSDLKLICNSRSNAMLIKAILEKDSLCNKKDYIFDNQDFKDFIETICTHNLSK